MNGIIIIDKPEGWTSHDVVAKLRGALKTKRIGHGGTLDPMATGVLPIFIGRGTRAVQFIENADKEYTAGLRLGIVTDTQDITGTVLESSEASITPFDLAAVLPSFIGAQKQIPPMYSAIKIGGKKLYELARRGEEIQRPARDITISDIQLLDGMDDHGGFLINVSCSKGTYVRTLCHDIGAALGCGATLSSLRRTRAGIFTIEMSHRLDDVIIAAEQGGFGGSGGSGESGGSGSSDGFDRSGGFGSSGGSGESSGSGGSGGILLPIDALFMEHPQVTLDEATTQKCKNGAKCRFDSVADGTYRFYGPDNEFLLLGEIKEGSIKTIKSFFTPDTK